MIVEILSAIRNADIPKNATGDLAPTGAPNRPEMLPFRSPGESTRRKAPELRGFFLETGHCPNSGTAWLGWDDSNFRMAEFKFTIRSDQIAGPIRSPRLRGGVSRVARVRPSALAVFMLITSSNLVGCSTGRSAGFAPKTARACRV
jgi:hypothetical protein